MSDPGAEREARAKSLLRLGWLFPPTYAAHIVEEWFGGFVEWFARVTGAGLSGETFLWLNGFALVGMTLGVALGYKFRRLRWLFVSFGAVTMLNGASHLAASLLTLSYSPGVVTGALVWLPLGYAALRAGRAALKPRHFVAGLAVGALMHAAVTLSAFFG